MNNNNEHQTTTGTAGEYVCTIRSGGRQYALYRAIIDGRGTWSAREISGGTETGDLFPITYEQARGLEPMNAAGRLARDLGRLLMPPRL